MFDPKKARIYNPEINYLEQIWNNLSKTPLSHERLQAREFVAKAIHELELDYVNNSGNCA